MLVRCCCPFCTYLLYVYSVACDKYIISIRRDFIIRIFVGGAIGLSLVGPAVATFFMFIIIILIFNSFYNFILRCSIRVGKCDRSVYVISDPETYI